MQHVVEEIRKENAELRSELACLKKAFTKHVFACKKKHMSTHIFFETKVINHMEKQVNTMQTWTIDKVVDMKRECIGVEERLLEHVQQTNAIVMRMDKEQDEERLMALDLFIHEKEKNSVVNLYFMSFE